MVPHCVVGARRGQLVDVALFPQEQELADQFVIGVHHVAPVARSSHTAIWWMARDDEPTRIS